MIRAFKKIIGTVYNEAIEDLCTRILYFFNTLDSYFIIAAALVWIVANPLSLPPLAVLLAGAAGAVILLYSDFYPFFTVSSVPAWIVLFLYFPPGNAGWILLLNVIVFLAVIYAFIGIPNSIISRDPRVGFIMIFNSLFTVAPTVVSFSMSVYFSSALCFVLISAPTPLSPPGALFWVLLAAGSWTARLARPRTCRSMFGRWPAAGPGVRRVVILNIDGCRLDTYRARCLPHLRDLTRGGLSFRNGLITVYRALTNPAFSSILTSVTPPEHRVRNNNFGQIIRVEALPDYVPTILYGSMHVRHFSKKNWETKIVSLPRNSIYRSDDIAMGWLREDLETRDEVRLFVMDLSEADFLGHCYGSYSRAYRDAIDGTGARIARFVEWCREKGLIDETAVIVCSDHGITCIDHSYLLFSSETYVPCLVAGPGIGEGRRDEIASIMDIGNTAACLLGVRYAGRACGKSLVEPPGGAAIQPEAFLGVVRETYAAREGRIPEGIPSALCRICGARPTRVCVIDRRGEGKMVAKAVAESLGPLCDVRVLPREAFRDGSLPDGAIDCLMIRTIPGEDDVSLFAGIDRALVPEGLCAVLGVPRRPYYFSAHTLFLSRLYMKSGGTACVSAGTTSEINDVLSRRFGPGTRMRPEEILEAVDPLSPVDPWERWKAALRETPKNFIEKRLPGYKIVGEFMHRSPALEQLFHGGDGSSPTFSKLVGRLLGGGCNLVSYVARKPQQV